MYPDALKSWLSCSAVTISPLYIVGGTVRDLLLGDQPKDIDLVCRDAKDFAYRLGRCKNAAVVPMEKKPAEPCYRVIDREQPDNYLDIAEMRGPTIYDDLGKRDFTINAIASEVREDGTIGPLIDPFAGAEDLKLKTIKMMGYGSFVSDPLRILRAARFSATLGFTIGPQTLDEMKKTAALLREVSGERITAELLLILNTPNSTSFIKDMDRLGILDVLFPEIPPMKGCQQDGFHHKDVWEHSLLVAKNCERVINDLAGYFGDRPGDVSINLEGNNRLPLLKLTALLHDIGKPLCRGINEETGRITFYKHDNDGAELAEALAERLKLSSQDRDYMVQLIAEHLHVLSLAGNRVRTATRMRWFRKMKDNAIPAIILGIADVESSLGSDSTEEWRSHYLKWSKDIVREYYETIRRRLESKNLITGSDLISLGMEPSPEMGGVLDILRNAQDTGDISSHEDALALAKSLLEKI